jgi:hypothetical protein
MKYLVVAVFGSLYIKTSIFVIMIKIGGKIGKIIKFDLLGLARSV